MKRQKKKETLEVRLNDKMSLFNGTISSALGMLNNSLPELAAVLLAFVYVNLYQADIASYLFAYLLILCATIKILGESDNKIKTALYFSFASLGLVSFLSSYSAILSADSEFINIITSMLFITSSGWILNVIAYTLLPNMSIKDLLTNCFSICALCFVFFINIAISGLLVVLALEFIRSISVYHFEINNHTVLIVLLTVTFISSPRLFISYFVFLGLRPELFGISNEKGLTSKFQLWADLYGKSKIEIYIMRFVDQTFSAELVSFVGSYSVYSGPSFFRFFYFTSVPVVILVASLVMRSKLLFSQI